MDEDEAWPQLRVTPLEGDSQRAGWPWAWAWAWVQQGREGRREATAQGREALQVLLGSQAARPRVVGEVLTTVTAQDPGGPGVLSAALCT